MIKHNSLAAAILATSSAIHSTSTPLLETLIHMPANRNDLAQSSVMDTNNYCHFAHDRVKNSSDNFYNIQSGSTEFYDGTFPEETMIRDVDHPHTHQGDLTRQLEEIEFVSSIDLIYDDQYHSLFGTTGIQADDIFQGDLGNCWFMHGASAVAQKPSRLERVFLNDELSSNGIYGFQFYILGVPTTVTIDDHMPLREDGSSVFAKVSEDGALWGPLIEKAFAKLNGNYEAIENGNPTHSIEVLTGAPSTYYDHLSTHKDQLFFDISAAIQNDDMVSAMTDEGASSVAKSHVYTVLSAHEENGVKLYRIRNPWGREIYTGAYSDSDTSNWDQSLQDAVGYENEDDGTFFIDIDTYHTEFVQTTIHLDTTNMQQSFFLVTDDDSQTGQHSFRVKAAQAQTIFLSSHTWPIRTYPEDCIADFDIYQHRTIVTDGLGEFTWDYGWQDRAGFPGIEMEANEEVTVTLNMDWRAEASKDFSLVAWSTGTQPALITPLQDEPNQTTFPFTTALADDQNAVNESGADDMCAVNPVRVAFNTWAQEMTCLDGNGWFYSYSTFGQGSFMYYLGHSCNANPFTSSFTFPQNVWEHIWISEGSLLMETTSNSDGTITKKFGISNGNYVAFYVQGYLDFPIDSITHEEDWSWSGDTSDQAYQTIQASGNDASCDVPADSTDNGTTDPTDDGTTDPTDDGTTDPTDDGTTDPTDDGTTDPNDDGTTDPTDDGTTDPTDDGTTDPTDDGTTDPTDDGTTDSTDDGTTDPADDGTTDPNIQAEIDDYIANFEAPVTNSCDYDEDYTSSDIGGHFNGFIATCPVYAEQAIMVKYTDSQENWDLTVDDCNNVEIESYDESDGRITKVYAVSDLTGPVGMNTIVFYRPEELDSLTAHSFQFLHPFTMPAGQDSKCGSSADEATTDNSATDADDSTPATDDSTQATDDSTTTSDDDQPAENEPVVCVDDDTTPQACLDDFVSNYEISAQGCYYDYGQEGSKILFYGGCDQANVSVDITVTMSEETWSTTLISSDSNIIVDTGVSKTFNLRTDNGQGEIDRFGLSLENINIIWSSISNIALGD